MNGIAANMVPSDEQLKCDHLAVIGFYSDMGHIVCRPEQVKDLKGEKGTSHSFCCKCGAKLEEIWTVLI